MLKAIETKQNSNTLICAERKSYCKGKEEDEDYTNEDMDAEVAAIRMTEFERFKRCHTLNSATADTSHCRTTTVTMIP